MVHLEQRAPVALIVLARIDRILAPLTWLAAAFAVLALFVGPKLIGAEKEGGASASAPAATAAAPRCSSSRPVKQTTATSAASR